MRIGEPVVYDIPRVDLGAGEARDWGDSGFRMDALVDPDIMPPDLTRRTVQALEAAGGTAKYTEYPGEAHLIQLRTYAEPELWTWLMAQRRAKQK